MTVPGEGPQRICPNPDCPHREATGNAAEYRADVERCADCDTPLVEPSWATESSEPERIEMKRLDDPLDPALAPIVVAMLEEAGVRHELAGEGVQDLFGAGRLGTGFNVLTEPVRLRVEAARSAEVAPPEPDDEEA